MTVTQQQLDEVRKGAKDETDKLHAKDAELTKENFDLQLDMQAKLNAIGQSVTLLTTTLDNINGGITKKQAVGWGGAIYALIEIIQRFAG